MTRDLLVNLESWRSPACEPNLLALLESELGRVTVTEVSGGREAQSVLSADPQRFLVVIIDTCFVEQELGSLITGVKQTNPAIEIVLLSSAPISWSALTLPRQYRSIIVSWDHDENALISCVAKLLEIIETKEDYAMPSQRMRKTALSQTFWSPFSNCRR